MSEQTKEKPVKQLRAGALSVAVWRRRGNDGTVFFSATPSRCYKDNQENWCYTDSFNRDDLPVVSCLMQQAFSWIVAQETKAKETAAA